MSALDDRFSNAWHARACGGRRAVARARRGSGVPQGGWRRLLREIDAQRIGWAAAPERLQPQPGEPA